MGLQADCEPARQNTRARRNQEKIVFRIMVDKILNYLKGTTTIAGALSRSDKDNVRRM